MRPRGVARTAHRRVVLCLLLASCTIGTAVANDAKQAAKETNAAFEETHYVAKMPLVRYSHLYVLPDGSPSDKKGRKKQGLVPGGGTVIQPGDPVKVRQGEIGESIYVYVKKKELIVGLNKKRGAKLNPASVHILYGRPPRAEDITPHKIARALSGIVEIKGYEPGSEVDAAFEAALARDETAEAERPIGPPTVLAVRLVAEPATLRPGQQVVIEMAYDVQSPGAAIDAVESIDVAFDGGSVPGYPRTETVARGPGSYSAVYRQSLPGSVREGTYTVKGEVCVGDDCISRKVRFEVVAR